MAIVHELNKEAWNAWVAERPEAVRVMCEKYPPDRLYKLTPNGERVTIYSYSEDGTVTVIVSAEYNLVMFERSVFGIKPEDLTECDLPDASEPLGAMLTDDEDIDAYVDAVRPAVLAARNSH